MTLICVPIFVDDPESAERECRAARDAGADLVELRVDAFFAGEAEQAEAQTRAILRLVAHSPLPVILTCRPVLEGGQYDGPDDARIAMLERAATASAPGEQPPSYLDVELATYTRSANLKQKVNLAVDHPGQVRSVNTSLILSAHDFHTRPPDLVRRLGLMAQEPAARVVKIAFRARSLRDNLELLDFLAERVTGKPTIALAMGPFGLMSRVLAPKFDAFLTFASLRRESETAPGQPLMDELISLYRFRSINPRTRVYGVVGWPVERSLSPLVHNGGFEAVGHDGVYLPLPIMPEWEQFKGTMLDLIEHAHLDFSGCAVTVPHKEHLVALAREARRDGDTRWHLDALSEVCGAGNTLVVTRDPKGRATRLDVHNTDGPAAVRALEQALGASVGGRRVVILGAGGTARAVGTSLVQAGAEVHVANRTPDRARVLVEDLVRAFPAEAAAPRAFTLAMAGLATALRDLAPAAVINCTTLGMTGGAGEGRSPLDDEALTALPPRCIVFDVVYRPPVTPLLAAAAGAGRPTLDGAALFLHQAAAQFELWTGRPAPRGLFTEIVRETLGRP